MTSTTQSIRTAADVAAGYDIRPLRFTDARLDELTERERQVLVFITNGYTNAEISRTLFLSINSIKT